MVEYYSARKKINLCLDGKRNGTSDLSYVTGPFLLENIEVVLVCCCFLCRKENLHPLLSEKGGISQDQTIWEVSEATFFLKLGGGVETFS